MEELSFMVVTGNRQCININVIDDAILENNDIFLIEAINTSLITPMQSSVKVTIANDDGKWFDCKCVIIIFTCLTYYFYSCLGILWAVNDYYQWKCGNCWGVCHLQWATSEGDSSQLKWTTWDRTRYYTELYTSPFLHNKTNTHAALPLIINSPYTN